MPIRDIRDVEAMATLDADARKRLKAAELLADAFIGVVFAAEGAGGPRDAAGRARGSGRRPRREGRASARPERWSSARPRTSRRTAPSGGPRRPFHWPLEFPDVFHGPTPGFDAIVGNPPFLGGQRITGVAGWRTAWPRVHIAEQRRGSADLVAYFFLRAWSPLRANGGQVSVSWP